eukprot:7784961-Pyramimonas_sp.AAC.1
MRERILTNASFPLERTSTAPPVLMKAPKHANQTVTKGLIYCSVHGLPDRLLTLCPVEGHWLGTEASQMRSEQMGCEDRATSPMRRRCTGEASARHRRCMDSEKIIRMPSPGPILLAKAF